MSIKKKMNLKKKNELKCTIIKSTYHIFKKITILWISITIMLTDNKIRSWKKIDVIHIS